MAVKGRKTLIKSIMKMIMKMIKIVPKVDHQKAKLKRFPNPN